MHVSSFPRLLGPWFLVPGPRTRSTRDRRVTRRVSISCFPSFYTTLRRIHMPPRRSTRSSARLSTEPDSNPQAQKQAPSSKRKRSTVDDTDIDGQEDRGKPPSRTARRSSTKATASVPAPRASSRLKSAPQGPDGEDEDGEPSRRAKRSRPSHELEDVREENEEEDTKPTIASRIRRAGSRPVVSSTSGTIGQDQVVPAEDESNEQVTAKPTSRPHSPRKSTDSSKPSTSRRGGRSSRSAAVTVKAEPPDEPALENIDDVDDGEIDVPATSQRKITKRSRKAKSLTPPRSVVKEDDTDIGENATAIVPNGEVADVLAEESTPVPTPKKLPSNTPPVYEEKSLLDNLPASPSKAKRPPLPLEDPQGPRPRLVIHKLVLVNFKSYAGCQEIGPFHRVGCFRCRNIKLISCSLFQRSSDLMVRASRILSMRYFLCSGTVPARCDKENSPNSYTTLRNIRICRSAV
jgi:structural maintenance of chromosome 4